MMTFKKTALLPSSGKETSDGAILSHKMGRSHSIHGTEKGFGVKNMKERDCIKNRYTRQDKFKTDV